MPSSIRSELSSEQRAAAVVHELGRDRASGDDGSAARARARAARRGRRARRAAPRSTTSSPSTRRRTPPHGRSHPPPSSARYARSAATAACTRGVVDRGDARERVVVVGAALHRQRALSHLREHDRRVEPLVGAVAEPEAVERRGGDHDRVEVGRRLLEPGVDVAAQLGEREIGTSATQLRAPAHRTGGDTRARPAARRASSRRARRAGRRARERPRARGRRALSTREGPSPSAPRRRRARRAPPAALP